MPRVDSPRCPNHSYWSHCQVRLYVRGASKKYVPIGWICRFNKVTTYDQEADLRAVINDK